MTTTQQLVDGLGGAMGSHYVAATDQLYFVEIDGKVSVLDLVRSLDTVVFSGTAVVPPDSSLRLSDGTSEQGGEIRWDHESPDGRLVMRPQGSCLLSYLGTVDYGAVSSASLQNVSYSGDLLRGEGAGSQMVEGAVFGVFNWDPGPSDPFDYAKVQVVHAGETLKLQWEAYRLRPAYRVLGTGYQQPMDIVVTSDGLHAYVTEGAGNLLRVDLSNAQRAAAALIASALIQPHQMALDEARAQAYVVEFNDHDSRLARVDLVSGAHAVVAGNLERAVGLVVTADGRTAYLSQQTGASNSICRVNLATGHRENLPVRLGAPASLAWSAGGESQILTTDLRTNELVVVDLTAVPVSVRPQAVVAWEPSSVAVVGPDTVLVCCYEAIVRVNLTGSVFTAGGDLLHGIGNIPKSRITDGYATTDPGYFFPVKDAPFGGTLPIMFNHQRAHAMGARFYQVAVDGVVQSDSWSDDLWIERLRRRVLTPAPRSGQFFAVRAPGEDWYNRMLGYRLVTSGLRDGPHTVEVRIFSAPDAATEIAVPRHQAEVVVTIDNQVPRAEIREIVHHDPVRGRQPVGSCGIVQGDSDEFTFVIDASDPVGQHLRGWSLGAVWGDNRSTPSPIASDSYEPGHVAPHPHQWAGVTGEVPAGRWSATVPGDDSSRRCAHTFSLHVWDRVIDGVSYIHGSTYTKSITLLLSPLAA